MAFSATLIKKGVMGDMRYEIWKFNAASVTSGNITTGLKNIFMASLNDYTTAGVGIANFLTTAGVVALTGLTSSDIGYVMVWGL